jgi:hypothetical protein
MPAAPIPAAAARRHLVAPIVVAVRIVKPDTVSRVDRIDIRFCDALACRFAGAVRMLVMMMSSNRL